jgi:hypothetical protein
MSSVDGWRNSAKAAVARWPAATMSASAVVDPASSAGTSSSSSSA